MSGRRLHQAKADRPRPSRRPPIRGIESSGEGQQAVNGKALSINAEFRSTNENVADVEG
jgi:hypothetical protein